MHRLRCFGRLVIEDEQGERVQLRSRKHLALLLYLAAHRDRRHDRERVARLFWDTEVSLARHSLSQALYDLRQHVPDLELDRTNREVGLGPNGLTYEGRDLEDAVREDQLGRAVRIYDGPFAPDLETVGGPDFERWVERERTRFRSLAEKALLRRVSECADDGRWGEMVVAGNRLVDMNPLNEEAHRAVIRGLWLQGDRGAALAHFDENEEFLLRELPGGLAPETRELVQKIRSSDRSREAQSVRERPRAEMVGREKEFRVLRDALADVMEGQSRFIVVRGEAGIGKTRLLEEFAEVAALEDVRLLKSRCYAAESDVPYGPIVDGLRDLAQEVADAANEEDQNYYQLGHLFPEAFGEPEREDIYTTSKAAMHRLAEELFALLSQVGSAEPLVWIIEDTHWIDRASRTLINYAVSRAADIPILVVETTRPSDPENTYGPVVDRPWTVLDIAPLKKQAVEELIEVTFTVPLEPETIEKIANLSGGNPFFVHELLKQRESHESLPTESGDSLTNGIERLLSSRLRKRSTQETRLLEAIAVAGRHATPKLLASITGLSLQSVAANCSSLYKARVIYDESTRIAFRHDLFSRYVYRNIGDLTRSTLHLLTAQHLESEDTVEVASIARHYAQTEETRKTFQYALDAAMDAANRYAYKEAVTFTDIALKRAGSRERRNKTLYLKAKAEYALGQLEAASTAAKSALASEGLTQRKRVELTLLRGEVLVERGKWRTAQRVLNSLSSDGVDSIGNGQAKLSWAKYLLLKAAVGANDRNTVEKLIAEDGAYFDEQSNGSVVPIRMVAHENIEELVLCNLRVAVYNAFYRNIRRAASLVSSLEAIVDELPYGLRRQVLSVGCIIANRLGQWDKAIVLNRRLTKEADEFNDAATLSMTRMNLAVLEMERGNVDEAVRITERCEESNPVDEDSNHTALIRTNFGDQRFFREEYAAASMAYKKAIELSEECGFDYLLPELYSAYGLSLLAEGKLNQASEAHLKVNLDETRLGGVQDRYKIYWFTAYQMMLKERGDPVKMLQAYASRESTTDIPSARRLDWLASLFAEEQEASLDNHTVSRRSPKDATKLKEVDLGWFAYHSRRWMRRVQSLGRRKNGPKS